MTISKFGGLFAATALTVTALGASPVLAQSVEGGSAGGAGSRDVNASTYGYGTSDRTADGRAIGIGGGGEANAVDGTAETRSKAQLNDRRAKQTSVATARDEDERARSRTRTMVRPNDTITSRTVSRYKERGEAPVRESTYTVTRPDGTTTTREGGRKNK